uniref:Uncharacterized protein n=1 Tax=viral metagenome TaxID=1070528 RepID=A0A6M3LME4_9ZZZZ
MLEEVEIRYSLDDEIVVLHFLTLIRLLDIDSDACSLYMFYIKTAKLQKTKRIFATNIFASKGLRWGKEKLSKAKKILIDNGFIEKVIKKDEHGKIIGNYLDIHYLKDVNLALISGLKTGRPETGTAENRDGGKPDTNALDKKINTIDKNINAEDEKREDISFQDISSRNEDIAPNITEKEKILEHWNTLAKTVKGINAHRSLMSRCIIVPYSAKKPSQPPVLIDIVTFYLTKHDLSAILQSITTYFEILTNPAYYYKYKFKTLGLFLHSPKGMRYFLYPDYEVLKTYTNTTNYFSEIRKTLKFVTVETDILTPLNKTNSTYLGFSLNTLKQVDPYYYYSELKSRIKQNELTESHLIWIEEAIAALILKKENLSLLKKFIVLHNTCKEKFK